MDLLDAVVLTYELAGQSLSDASVKGLVLELSAYPEASVIEALARCRRELRKVTLADILDRLPGQHPQAEEAWALVARGLNNEQVSLVWTEAMREAFAVASALARDPIAARMAFKESYQELVGRARAGGQAPMWSVCLGYDPHGRVVAIEDAVRRNQISQQQADRLLPHCAPVDPSVLALVESIGK